MCNVGACDADCQLGFWGEWSSCSKACGTGLRVRRREATEMARGMGKCPDEGSDLRLERISCNDLECPAELRCNSQVDVLLVVDSSGSVRPEGFSLEQSLARSLVSKVVGEGAQVGVVAFADEAEVVAPLTFDAAALDEKIGAMRWLGARTNLAAGLMTALNVLLSGSRASAQNVVVVVTDGSPNSQEDVRLAAAKVRDQARLLFVPTAESADLAALYSWASVPAEQNVVPYGNETALVVDVCPDVACVGDVTDLNRTTCEGLA